MLKIATPISHFFNNRQHAFEISNKSDCLECRDQCANTKLADQELFHCHLQPIHKLGHSDFRYLEDIIRLKPDLKLITFHATASCDNPIKDVNIFQIDGGVVFQPGGQQYSRNEMLEYARRNFSQIKEIVGRYVNIALENNNYYPTEAYRYVTDPEFIRDVVYENDIYFLFDIAHAKVSAHNKKVDYSDYIKGLPLERAIQIHISRKDINEGNVAYDAHNLPKDEDWEEVKRIISTYQSVEYLTVEYYKDVSRVIKSLEKAREIVDELS